MFLLLFVCLKDYTFPRSSLNLDKDLIYLSWFCFVHFNVSNKILKHFYSFSYEDGNEMQYLIFDTYLTQYLKHEAEVW